MLTVDYLDEGGVREWHLTADGVTTEQVPDYRPTLYLGDHVSELYGQAGGPAPSIPAGRETPAERLVELGEWLAPQEAVVSIDVEQWRQSWRTPERPLLRVDVRSIDAVIAVAQRAQQYCEPGAVTCYNVDLSRQFRYALETETDATPDTSLRELRTLELGFPVHEAARGVDALPQLRVAGERVGSNPRAVVEQVQSTIETEDPDVLVVDTAEVVPLVFEAADLYGVTGFAPGRRPGWSTLAGQSTYQSYGRVGHSPARYHIPGRVIVDRSNTFFWRQGGLAGCLDLVERAGLPLQELSWASIGRVLTAMQIREARSQGVLVPWRPWRPEFVKEVSTLDAADRGGATLAPAVGVHEAVYELDFASMYPNIIREYNVSPETVRCGCCDEDQARDVVPELGYTICRQEGYLGDVLGPLIDDRDVMKAAMQTTDDPDERTALENRSAALKWILVACFGYQGHANAKFGRIECHEVIRVLGDLGYDVGTDHESVADAIVAFQEKYESRVGHVSAGTPYEVPLYAEMDAFFELVETVPKDTIRAQVTGPYAPLFRPLIGYRIHTDSADSIEWVGVDALIEEHIAARDSGAYDDSGVMHWGGTHIESWKWQFKDYFQNVVLSEFDLTSLTAEDISRFFDMIENPSEEFDVVSNVPAKMMGGQFHRLAWGDIVDLCHSDPAKAASVMADLFNEDLHIVDRLNEFHEFCRHLTTREENERSPGSVLRAATALLMYAYPEHHITFQYQRMNNFFDRYSTADGVDMGFNARQYREVAKACRRLLEKIETYTDETSMIDVQTLIYVANDA